MKKVLLITAYWLVSILVMATVLSSLGYRFSEALFLGTLFLPGALAAKFFLRKVDREDRKSRIKDTVFIVLGILVGEIFLFMLAHRYIMDLRAGFSLPANLMPDIPAILTNPVFIAFILTTLAVGSHFFETWLDRRHPGQPAPIKFTSDRKPVSLSLDEILYVESNDDVTTVVATEGRRYRNYTSISQWESNLSPRFIRIHRAYLVNRTAVTGVDVDLLYVGDTQLPISRKYKDAVADWR